MMARRWASTWWSWWRGTIARRRRWWRAQTPGSAPPNIAIERAFCFVGSVAYTDEWRMLPDIDKPGRGNGSGTPVAVVDEKLSKWLTKRAPTIFQLKTANGQ